MAQQSLTAGIGRPEQYVTVYSAMETAPFLNPPVPPAEVRRQFGIADDEIVVGTIARLFYLKGHEDLLELAPALCARFPKLKFMWVGDGLLRPEYERQIEKLGLKDRFVLTGLVPPARIPELCGAMDVMVHPSRREGLARALAQAGLAGIPVITYDIDGNREGLLDGQSGFVIPPFDRAKLSEKLGVLLADEPLRRTMGERGRQFALARFDAKVMVEGLERVYRETLDRKRATADQG
jgi:glycosyltransferase involved in cell wall biosynthesis